MAGPAPSLTLLTGLDDEERRRLLRESVGSAPTTWIPGSPLPPPLALEVAGGGAGSWGELLDRLLSDLRAPGLPPARHVLVFDDAQHLVDDRRWEEAFTNLWSGLRQHALPVHVVVAGRAGSLADAFALRLLEGVGLRADHLHTGALGLREAAGRVPEWSPSETLEAYALVGGVAGFWDAADPGRSPAQEIQRLVLAPGAPLRGLAADVLRNAGVQGSRPLALVYAMANGAREWGEIRRRARVFGSSSELGPYMKELVEVGVVVPSSSLDASPRSRRRRYELADPIVAFWFGLALPHLAALDRGDDPAAVWGARIHPHLPGWIQGRLPRIVREHLSRHGDEGLPARAREVGGLWGSGYDIPVAGILGNGAAVYGMVLDAEGRSPAQVLDELDDQIARTSYGFSREARLRMIFVPRGPSHALARQVARRRMTFLLTPADLVAGTG